MTRLFRLFLDYDCPFCTGNIPDHTVGACFRVREFEFGDGGAITKVVLNRPDGTVPDDSPIRRVRIDETYLKTPIPDVSAAIKVPFGA